MSDHPGQTALQRPPSLRKIARWRKDVGLASSLLIEAAWRDAAIPLIRAEIDDLIGYRDALLSAEQELRQIKGRCLRACIVFSRCCFGA